MKYNTRDFENVNLDFVVTESHRKYHIRCNPVQSSSSEIRNLDVEEMNKKSVLCELERQKEKLMEKGNVLQGKIAMKILSYSRINELKLMKQQKRISRLRTQGNAREKGKTLMKQQKRVYKIKIQSNTKKEGKTLMKQLKEVSKMKAQSKITREGNILMKQLKRTSMLKITSEKKKKIQKWTEKKLKDVQGMSMVDPSILATAAYHIIEGKWLRESTVGPEYCCDIYLQWCYKSNVLKLKISKYGQEILDRCYN